MDCDKEIPSSWDLYGNLKRDPIGISLLVRVLGGSQNEKVIFVPAGHTIYRPPAHDVKGMSQEFESFLDPFDSPAKKSRTFGSFDQASPTGLKMVRRSPNAQK